MGNREITRELDKLHEKHSHFLWAEGAEVPAFSDTDGGDGWKYVDFERETDRTPEEWAMYRAGLVQAYEHALYIVGQDMRGELDEE